MSWTAHLQSLSPISGPESRVPLYRVMASNQYGEGVIVKQTQCNSEDEALQLEEQGRLPHCHPHPNICECLGWTQEPIPGSTGYYSYTFWQPVSESLYDDLSRRIAGETWSFYTEGELWRMYGQLLTALSYLQECNIAHRDIQPANIMKDWQGNLLLFDFIHAKEINPQSPSVRTLLGTKPYMAPALRKACIERRSQQVFRLSHDVYKSDVYSLGMVLLHLSLLELPVRLTSLQNLQQLIDTTLDELTQRDSEPYSERWVGVLRRMLRVEEDNRPDFKLLQSSPSYDDEYLQASPGRSLLGDPLCVSLKCGLDGVRVSPHNADEAACVLTIQAEWKRRCAMDLVCVVDESGSVDERTLEFVKTALFTLLEKLGEQDRFSLVGFSDTAERKCPLVRCDASGKRKISAHINLLRTRDLTNLTAGFSLGIKILQERNYQNQASILLLFTDEQSNVGDSPSPACQRALTKSGLDRFTVSCFGLGDTVNFKLLEELANLSGGKYCRLTSVEQIEKAVAGGWPSVVARDLRVKLNVLNSSVQCEITKVYSQTGTTELYFPSLSMNERIDQVFLVRPRRVTLISPQRCPTIKAELVYTDNEGVSSSKLVLLDVKFVRWGVAFPRETEVYQKWHRARINECLQQVGILMSDKLIKQAEDCVQKEIDLMEKEYSGDEKVGDILRELRRVKAGLSQSETSNSASSQEGTARTGLPSGAED